MQPGPRKVSLFVLHFMLIFTSLLWMYPKFLDPYQHLVLGSANLILECLSPAMRIQEAPQGRWHISAPALGPRRSFTVGGEGFNQVIFLNLVVVPALLFATPAGLRERLWILLWGLLLLFVLNSLAVTGFVRASAHFCRDGASLACRQCLAFFTPGDQVAAAALWALLTWRYWLPPAGGRGADTTA